MVFSGAMAEAMAGGGGGGGGGGSKQQSNHSHMAGGNDLIEALAAQFSSANSEVCIRNTGDNFLRWQ